MARFMRRPPSEQRLALLAALLVAFVRLGLAVASVRAVRRILDRVVARPGMGSLVRSAPDEVGLAMARAASAVPGATCLVQSLALEALLRGGGHPARLCVGFARGVGHGLAGHAWVESAGWMSAGAAEVAGYARARPARAARR